MLNCTDQLCHLHTHHDVLTIEPPQVMSGDDVDDIDVNDLIQNILNGTESELSDLSHVDAPNDGLYVACGVLIAMVTVALIIVLLALTISKLRKREDSSPAGAVIQEAQATVAAPVLPVAHTPNPNQPPLPNQLPFLWTVRSSHYDLCNSSRDTLVTAIPCDEVSECKGFRKNLGGKWKRLLKKKQHQEVYTIPPELRPQLKQIYVY